MTDEILIERLEEANDRALLRFYYNDDETRSASHWDEWMIDNRIDCCREEEDFR